MARALLRAVAAAALFAAAASSWAHDTWLSRTPQGLGVSTGERYPAASSAPAFESLGTAICSDMAGRRTALRPLKQGTAPPNTLSLRAPQRAGAMACWIELRAHEIELEPSLVETYFHEIRPPEAQRQLWARQRADGVPWRERYRKFARIETPGSDRSMAALRRPVGLPLEIVPLGETALRSGQHAGFQVLAEGRPVAGLAIELVSERSRFGVWAVTDEQGRVGHVLPFTGAWLLRAVRLEPQADGRWESLFATLAFEAR